MESETTTLTAIIPARACGALRGCKQQRDGRASTPGMCRAHGATVVIHIAAAEGRA
ncbi:MAG TPA: hypothetical protein VF544_22880 [Pyrinomonadaceae bacterium]